jgi:dolichol-phosphate mannosyltransferase
MVTTNEVDLTVILPAYLEEENLRILLPRLKSVLNSIVSKNEILVIDTETALDGTKLVCEEFNAIYINRVGGNFYGDAVKTGIKHSVGKKIIFMDADGSHAPEFIKNIYELKDQADIVIASRYIKGGFTENSAMLVFMSLVLNVTYALVLNLKVKDVSNSFKLYDADKLRELELVCNNFDIVEEIIYKLSLLNKNLRIIEIPFTFKKRMFGETKRNLIVFMLNYIVTIIKLRLMTAKKLKK